MNPLKILGLKKSEKHNYYELENKQEFFSGFRKLLVDLGFGEESSNIEIYSFGRPPGDDGEYILTKEEDINDYIDRHFYFENNNFRIDVVFGKKKIFLVINSDKDKQEKISEKVQKFCSFQPKS
ncbi:MAG: hypothetical protein Q8N99_05455 [Nanoarchaeota archaeon]|nr:hypothetical protein [Nanoarchaeota archaeon]